MRKHCNHPTYSRWNTYSRILVRDKAKLSISADICLWIYRRITWKLVHLPVVHLRFRDAKTSASRRDASRRQHNTRVRRTREGLETGTPVLGRKIKGSRLLSAIRVRAHSHSRGSIPSKRTRQFGGYIGCLGNQAYLRKHNKNTVVLFLLNGHYLIINSTN